MAAGILRIHGDTSPRAQRRPTGYATVPRQILQRTDLLPASKHLLAVLIGLCYGTEKTRASIQDISRAAGMKPGTIREHLVRLTKTKLIARRPDPEKPGGPSVTHVLIDPQDLPKREFPAETIPAGPETMRFKLDNNPPKLRVIRLRPPVGQPTDPCRPANRATSY